MTAAERDTLILANTGLAYRTARHLYRTDPVVRRLGEESDAEQEALTALVKAAPGYDPGKGFRFSTYAVNAIRNELRKQGMAAGVVYVPCYLCRKVAAEHRYAAQARAAMACGSLDGDDTPEPTAPAADDPDPDGTAARELTRLRRALVRLPARLRQVLRARFGLAGDRPQTLEAIGSQMHLSKERIRQLEARALELLRERLGRTASQIER